MNHPDIQEVVLSEEEIKARVAELGAQISEDYKGEPLVVITILRGGAIFATDLVRSIKLPLELDFMAVSSYGNGTTSSGRVQILKDLSSSIEGKHVLIVFDDLTKQAEAYRESKINEAEGQAARFSELFAEYQNYPLITKQRLFYEAMEEILPDMKLYIVDDATGVQTSLPLESYATVNMGGDAQ